MSIRSNAAGETAASLPGASDRRDREQFGRGRAFDQDEPLAVEVHDQLDGCLGASADPMEREVVEQLVRQDHAGGRSCAEIPQLAQLARDGERTDRWRLIRDPRERRAGAGPSFDRDELGHGGQVVRQARQQPPGERPVTGAGLDQQERIGAVEPNPQILDAPREEDAERRRHVRARDEIAVPAHDR